MTTEQTPQAAERNLRKERIGVVTSTAMNKSIVVAVERKEKHPKYGKFVNKTSKFMAHDEQETCNVGDTVRIMETRPLSKRKCWRLVEVVERAKYFLRIEGISHDTTRIPDAGRGQQRSEGSPLHPSVGRNPPAVCQHR
jgi:small subunit ribosomal protein S17